MSATFKPTFVRRLLGSVYCFFWFFSIFSGFFTLICPAFPLAVLAPCLYRKWTDIVFGMWEPYPVAMMEILLGVKVIMSGDMINPSEDAIVVMNHRTRLDWNFLWAAFFHSAHPHCHSLKFILKAAIMHLPGPGWVMQACSFLFIHRNWEKDQKLLANSLQYLQRTGKNCQILIFPEGTDLTPRSLERSHAYADKNGISRYFRVIHPKTTGFVFLANTMRQNRQLRAIYDLTVGYPKMLAETELDLFKGKFPNEIHFNVKRYDASELPLGEGNLKNWLCATWKAKEQNLQRFYNSGSFTIQDFTPDCLEQNNTNELLKKRAKQQECDTYFACPEFNSYIPEESDKLRNGTLLDNIVTPVNDTPGNTLYLAFLFWTNLVFCFFYFLATNLYFQVWVGFHFVLFFILSFVSEGFHQILAKYNSVNKKCD